jgi:type I restriction enzyme S subunit
MKLVNFDNPVMSSWFELNGCRLDSKPYLSGSMEAKAQLARLAVQKEPLYKVTQGIFNGPRFARVYVDDPEYGVPFLGSTDILNADLSNIPYISKKIVEHYPDLMLGEGWTLITCSGTIGRMTFSRADMEEMAGSQHFMRVVPDPEKIPPGYLYAYLSGKFGVPQVVEGTYGAIIQHIEPHHIAGLPVPRLGKDVETMVDNLVRRSSSLRTNAVRILEEAKQRFHWLVEGILDNQPSSPRINFVPSTKIISRLDAVYHDYAAYQIEGRVKKGKYTTIGDICRRVFLPGIFKRIQAEDEAHGVPYYLGESIYWLEPVAKYLLSLKTDRFEDVRLEKGTILVQAFGQRGGLPGRPAFVGEHLDGAATTHMLVRLNTHNPELTGYLYAYIASLAGYRQIIKLPYGGSIPHFDEKGISGIPVPLLPEKEMLDLSVNVLSAFSARDEAYRCDLQARRVVEDAIIKGSV